MVFVYQGAGKKQKPGADLCQLDKKCQKLACDIQWCLSRNKYNQTKCQSAIQAWNSCCEGVKKRYEESMKAAEEG